MLPSTGRSFTRLICSVAGVCLGLQSVALLAQDAPAPAPAADQQDAAPAPVPAAADKPAADGAAPATRPATRGKTPAAKDTGGDQAKGPQTLRLTRASRLDPKSPLGQAIEQIRHEYESGDKIRTESSFFTETPCADLTTDNLFVLLDRKLSPVPAADAYIKWQLLSSLPKTLADQYDAQVVSALNKAPVPGAMPGLVTSEPQRQQLANQARRLNQEQERAATAKMDADREKLHRLNAPILAYRSALSDLLKDTHDGAMAAFGDAWHRTQAGEDNAAAVEKAIHLSIGWINASPPRDALQRFSNELIEMRDLKGPDVIARFEWNEQKQVFDVQYDHLGMDRGGRIRDLQLDVKHRLETAGQGAPDKQTNTRRRTGRNQSAP